MNKTDISYIAGFIDADGSISIARENPSSRNRRVNPSYTPSLGAYSTRKEAITFIYKTFGGTYALRKGKEGNQDGYEWRKWGQQTKKTIVSLLPYLRIKKKQAQVLLKLISWKEQNKKNQRASYSQEGTQYLEYLYKKISKLQVRGKPVSASE